MKVTLLDAKTGERRDCSNFCDETDFGVYWWCEGNGSCDCNRALAFDRGEGEDHSEEQRLALGLEENCCFGAERWLIVDVSGDLEEMTREEVLAMANSDYPPELVAKHMTPNDANERRPPLGRPLDWLG